MRGLIAALNQRPRAVLAGFLALHLLVWTALPTLLYPNLPLDLIEALTYGREWQLGYDKLPPLPWWSIEILHRIIGLDVAYYALAQAAVILAFVAVWALARPLVGAAGALAALLILDGLHYFHFTAAKFNHDVIQLPLWALAGYGFHAGLRGGRLRHWLLVGAAIGSALWAKYFVAMLVAPLALFLLLDRDARKALATPGPWLAAVLALAVAGPHLVWLVQNDFLPFAYANARAAPVRGLLDHLLHPAAFAVGQVVFMLPALLIAALLFWPRSPASLATAGADAFDRRIVMLLAFGPAAAVIVLSALSGRGTIAMWGYPLWLFLGLWLVLQAGEPAPARLARIATAWAGVFAVFALAFTINYSVLPAFDHRYRAVFYPGDRLGEELSRRFRAATGRPLAYVVGEMWDGGNVAHYAPEQPRVLIDGDPRRAPWIDLGDLLNKGAVVVWTGGDPDIMPIGLRRIAGDAQVQPPFTLPYRRGEGALTVGWAILRPQPAFAAATPDRCG
ncbi:MAG: glycosyltransferase family 39 protein [Hyphomicrobiales bacterium]|nr:glycosyltransferase family 39 protein [Hyphomicrobiales bacterium]